MYNGTAVVHVMKPAAFMMQSVRISLQNCQWGFEDLLGFFREISVENLGLEESYHPYKI
jgi:hypothetical protein